MCYNKFQIGAGTGHKASLRPPNPAQKLNRNSNALERSVCDTIRFRADIGIETVENIVQNYMKLENRQMGRLLAYADAMRVGKIVRTTLEGKKQAD